MSGGFGNTPTTTTQGTLTTNQFPISEVYVPNTANGNLTALQGGTPSTDSNSLTSAPVMAQLAAGSAVVGHVIVDSAGAVSVVALPALPAGSNAIGTVGVTSLPTLPSGTNVIGHVVVDSAGSVSITSLPSLPAGSNLIGGTNLVDSAGTNKASVSASGAVKVDGSATTQPVSGTFWQATQPVSGTVSISSLPTSPTGTPSSVAASTSPAALLASNTNRKGATIYNESSATLYLGLFSHSSLTTTTYSVPILSNTLYELSPRNYTGEISGVWSSAAGYARITEMS